MMSSSNEPIDKDKALLREVHGMIQRFVDGESSPAMTFDLLRVKEVSMEKVYLTLMTQEDYEVISLMLRVLRHPKCVREQVFDVIVEKLNEMKKDGEIAPDAP